MLSDQVVEMLRRGLTEATDKSIADVNARRPALSVIAAPGMAVSVLFVVHPQAFDAAMLAKEAVKVFFMPSGEPETRLTAITPREKPATDPSVN